MVIVDLYIWNSWKICRSNKPCWVGLASHSKHMWCWAWIVVRSVRRSQLSSARLSWFLLDVKQSTKKTCWRDKGVAWGGNELEREVAASRVLFQFVRNGSQLRVLLSLMVIFERIQLRYCLFRDSINNSKLSLLFELNA